MMKLGLALLAIGAAATRISAGYDDDECYSDWIWEDCSGLYYQVPYCADEYCGWFYSPTGIDALYDYYWVSCAKFDTWEYCP